MLSPHATWVYSRIRPPSRSRHRTRTFALGPELATLTASTGQGTRQERAARAAAVLNKAALIASDCGIPALARELCHRQYAVLAQSVPLPGWAAGLALQSVLNPRQFIRDGHGDDDVSGHLDPGDPACRLGWGALARSGTSLVILMGMRNLPAIAARLIMEGYSPVAPATCVADASLPTQRVVRTRLEDLPAQVTAADLANPATVIVS